MAKEEEVKVTPSAVTEEQAKRATPTSEMSGKELKVSIAYSPDADLHPDGEPEKEADKTSYPVPNDAEINDPPLRTNRPDVPIVRTLATGAGAHEPPSPDEVHPDGRPVYDEVAASEGK